MTPLRALLDDLADLLGELTTTAANIAARPAGTIGRSGHGDGLVVAALDPWVCPLPGDPVLIGGAPGRGEKGPRRAAEGQGVSQEPPGSERASESLTATRAEPTWRHLRGDDEDPRCMCDLASVRNALTTWVRALLADPELDLEPPRSTLTGDLASWLADNAAQVDRHEGAWELAEDMRAVRAAVQRFLRVAEPDPRVALHAWLPVHQALGVAGLHAPGHVVSRATAYQRARWANGGRVVRPADLIRDTPDTPRITK